MTRASARCNVVFFNHSQNDFDCGFCRRKRSLGGRTSGVGRPHVRGAFVEGTLPSVYACLAISGQNLKRHYGISARRIALHRNRAESAKTMNDSSVLHSNCPPTNHGCLMIQSVDESCITFGHLENHNACDVFDPPPSIHLSVQTSILPSIGRSAEGGDSSFCCQRNGESRQKAELACHLSKQKLVELKK